MFQSKHLLTRLGAGEKIAVVCSAGGMSRAEFDAWWQAECRRRVPDLMGSKRLAGVSKEIRIARDGWGIPHVQAANDADLFFGFGYATAQDRLFQLDFLRRKARGRLAEVLGAEALESDLLNRTLGLSQVAQAEYQAFPVETRHLLDCYTAGINAFLETNRERLPIEFDLLDYQPEKWLPTDSLAIAGEFRWYLTGRFPVLAIPELARRTLGEGPLYQAFLQSEADDESIMPAGSYPANPQAREQGGVTLGPGPDGPGSNNWVLAGRRTTTGIPLLASDPHLPFAAVCTWHEIHLQGGSFQVAGVACAGFPGIMIGRSQRLAWGITNNICSLRDLYEEKIDPKNPDCFLYDGRAEPARQRLETIQVKNQPPVLKTIRSSRNGPIVNEVLPAPVRNLGPISLRWLGFAPCGWLTALLGMNRARTAEQFRQATRPWLVPTFNLVYADVDGHIGHQCVGRIPLRAVPERGFRPGWDPKHQWQGLIPFEGMPHQADPERGYIVTANNRLAADDYPYPLSGTWAGGHRARRIRQQLQSRPLWSREDCQRLQWDVRSGRAAQCTPHLLSLLHNETEPRFTEALSYLRAWDYQMEADWVAPALFNVFFAHWCRRVAAERFPPNLVEFMAGNISGLAAALLAGDEVGWFKSQDRQGAARQAFQTALEESNRRLGPEMAQWNWSRMHLLLQKHFLSGRGDLGLLLDRSGQPTRGDGTTVCNNVPDGNFAAYLGPSYRMVADLADPNQGLWAIEVSSTSGNPGSPHYDDQLLPWNRGAYHYLPLDGSGARPADLPTLSLLPGAQ